MAIRVALIGTGNCGSLALRQLIEDARFDLTGVWVSSEAKVGRDAGELAGLDVTTGVLAVNDLDAIIAAKPDCVVYCAMGDVRPPEAMADVREFLEAGIDVVGSAPGLLQYPWGVIPDKSSSASKMLREQGNSSVFITGVDPGFVTDLLPFALAGTCQSIQQIRTMEIADYATYDGATVMFDVMGFGNADRRLCRCCTSRACSASRGAPRSAQLAAGLGIEVDEIRDSVEQEPAPEDFDVAVGTHQEGHGRGGAVPDRGHGRRRAGDRRRARHPAARRPAARLGAAGAGGRVLPGRDHRRTVLRHGHLSRPAATATTTTRRSWPRRAASSTPSPTSSRPPPGIRTTLDLPLVTGKGVLSPGGSPAISATAHVRPLQADAGAVLGGLDGGLVGQGLHQRDAAAAVAVRVRSGASATCRGRTCDRQLALGGVVGGLDVHGARDARPAVGELRGVGQASLIASTRSLPARGRGRRTVAATGRTRCGSWRPTARRR